METDSKKGLQIGLKGWLIIIAIMILFVIPLLTAVLSIRFPLARYVMEWKEAKKAEKNYSYRGTEYSYFNADSEASRQAFEDIAFYFNDLDWEEYIAPILKTAANPGEAAMVIKNELGIDLADYNIDVNEAWANENAENQ